MLKLIKLSPLKRSNLLYLNKVITYKNKLGSLHLEWFFKTFNTPSNQQHFNFFNHWTFTNSLQQCIIPSSLSPVYFYYSLKLSWGLTILYSYKDVRRHFLSSTGSVSNPLIALFQETLPRDTTLWWLWINLSYEQGPGKSSFHSRLSPNIVINSLAFCLHGIQTLFLPLWKWKESTWPFLLILG